MAKKEKERTSFLEIETEKDHPVNALMESLEKMSPVQLRERIAWLVWTVEKTEERVAELESRLDNSEYIRPTETDLSENTPK